MPATHDPTVTHPIPTTAGLLRWGVPQRVPGFTFTSGNVGKIIALPLYALGALASLVVRRNSNLWAFGSGAGLAEGSLALYEYVSANDPSRRLVWLASTPAELDAARERGMTAVAKTSVRGFWITLRSGLVSITHGFGDVNRFATRGAFIVQMWHGIPLKHVALDSPATFRTGFAPRSRLMERMLRRAYRRTISAIDLLPAASELSAQRLRGAFALPASTVVVTGDPRDDVLFKGSPKERALSARRSILASLGESDQEEARLVLHAPTWRDGETDPGIPTPAQWIKLNEWLTKSDSILLVRPHPHGVGDYAAGPQASDRIHMFDSTIQGDISAVLSGIDLLITDYSSIAYDFALTGGPIAFLAPDLEHYVATRGLYEPYADFSGGMATASWDELVSLLRRADSDTVFAQQMREHSVNLADRHHLFRDGRNTDRVYDEITSLLKEHP